MEFLNCILIFAVSTLFIAISLWVGARLTKIEATFPGMLVVAAISSALYLIPGVGWLISLIALFFMLKRFTTADIWPDAVLLVVAASAIRFVAILLLALIMTNIIGDTIGG
jgi:hypothetical protein